LYIALYEFLVLPAACNLSITLYEESSQYLEEEEVPVACLAGLNLSVSVICNCILSGEVSGKIVKFIDSPKRK
jgi:hypothetical protein